VAGWKSRCFTAALMFGAVAGLPEVHTASAQDKKPNIVMLMTDDTGWGDFAMFTRWYGQASCTAGRASL
jgi:hypothetical protein